MDLLALEATPVVAGEVTAAEVTAEGAAVGAMAAEAEVTGKSLAPCSS